MTEREADIAYLRSLAEEGARSPVQGGSILFAAGLIYGAASLAHWGVASGLLPLDPSAYGAIWGVAVIAFFAALIILINRLKRAGGVETAANRAFSIVWSGLGWGIFALFMSWIAVEVVRGGEIDMAAMALLIPSIIMAFYGVGWAVTATMLRDRGLWLLAFASFAAAPALALASGSTEQYLAYAAALFGLIALPGFLLMRKAASA